MWGGEGAITSWLTAPLAYSIAMYILSFNYVFEK